MNYLDTWQWAFDLGRQLEPGETLGWKTARADLTTDGHGGRDVRYYPGDVLEATYPLTQGDPCPSAPGDGYCVARTFRGAASGGLPLGPVIVLAWSGLLGESSEKIRARRVRVLTLWDGVRLIRAHGSGANLSGARLSGADLSGARLWGADLSGADLSGADLRGADLRGANLSGARLWGADLSGADLRGADLRGADLRGADLRGANLSGARLSGADLSGADLRGADLRGANLSGARLWGADLSGARLWGADLGSWERGPDGYARRIANG